MRTAMMALLALAACGRQAALTPRAGQSAVPVAAGETAARTPEAMLKPPPEAAPERVDDIIRRPERERGDDPFDPAPPGARR